MIRKGFLTSLPICALIALLAAFLFVSPVFAQDEVPPEVTPVEISGEAFPVEEPPTEVVPTDATEAEPAEELPAESAPVEETPVEEASLAEALDDAGVVLAETTGEPVTLAARSTGMLISEGDPYYTVGSTTYQFFYATAPGSCGVNCFLSPTPITAALQHMASNNYTPTDRKLYIQAGTYDEYVDVDGSLNGVKGLLGIEGKDSPAEDIIINGRLYIRNFTSGFSVNNLTVKNTVDADYSAIQIEDNAGTIKLTDVNAQATGEDSTGIRVIHTGPVELNRVDSSGNGYLGAWIINANSVKITNSTFDNNLQNVNNGVVGYDDTYDETGYIGVFPNYSGLFASVLGPVNVYGVSASGNKGDGAKIISWNNPISIKNSIFDFNDQFNEVGLGNGLTFVGNTAVVENLQANNNNMGGLIATVNTSFLGTHLHTENNIGTGIYVESCLDFRDTDTMCDNPGTGTVTIKNSGISNNGGSGLDIYAKGAVTVTSIFSGWNGDDGVRIVTSDSPGFAAITLKGLETPGNDYGIYIDGRGVMTLSDIKSSDNRMDGVGISNLSTSAVTITNASGLFNETRNNGWNGYTIITMGPVTVMNLDSHDNGMLGGYIDNSFVPTTALPTVTVNVLAPAGFVNGYWNNGTGGLQVHSRGAVTISKISVTDNRGAGLDINNIPPGLVAGAAITITDANINHNRNGHWDEILEEWVDDDSNSDEDGLRILSKGLITLSNVSSNNNDGYGATLTNTAGIAGVTINATTGKGNEFQWNSLDGLRILTNGAVALTNIYASNNLYDDGVNPNLGGYGLYIDNHTGTAAVTIKQVGSWCGNNFCTEGNSFSNNLSGGLWLSTKGTITVAFFQARDNRDMGMYIDDGGTGAVTLSGTSNYWENLAYNWGSGLQITAHGNITLSKIQANSNGNNGAALMNNGGAGNVTLTDAYFDRNGNCGLSVSTTGTVSWKNGSANENRLCGANISNLPSLPTAAGKAVTVTNVDASRNGGTGIFIESKGVVTVTDSQADTNSRNDYPLSFGDQWTDNLSDNQTWRIMSSGTEDVTIEVESGRFNPWISVTDQDGNWVTDGYGTDGLLTLHLGVLDYGEYTIHVYTQDTYPGYRYAMRIWDGVKPLVFIEHEDAANGIYVDNHTGTGAVTITNTNNHWNSNNSGTNIVVLSAGVVTLKGMELNDGGDDGLLVNNTFSATGTPGVALTNVNFNINDGNGANIVTKGTVTVKSGSLSGNRGHGFYVNNTTGTPASSIIFSDINVDDWGSTESGIYLRYRRCCDLYKRLQQWKRRRGDGHRHLGCSDLHQRWCLG